MRQKLFAARIYGDFLPDSLKLAAEKHEAGLRALQEAKLLEAEHKARLVNIHGQTERLRLQEQRILEVGGQALVLRHCEAVFQCEPGPQSLFLLCE